MTTLGERPPHGIYSASHQLKALRAAGLIRVERRPQSMAYALAGAKATAEGLVFLHESGLKVLLRLGEGA